MLRIAAHERQGLFHGFIETPKVDLECLVNGIKSRSFTGLGNQVETDEGVCFEADVPLDLIPVTLV